MPPVLTMSGGNYDYDYDTVQPYFLGGEEEDFYPPPCSRILQVPGDDMWKKFELLPTPPLSPRRRPPEPAVPLPLHQRPSQILTDPHLEVVSELLDDGSRPSAALLQSFIIHDCMWSSSFAAAAKLEEVVNQRLSSLRDSTTSTSTNLDTPEEQEEPGHLQNPHMVDPSAGDRGGRGAAGSPDPAELSSSDSDSDDEEEEAEEEEEVKVDVVTMERRKSPLILKRSHVSVHQHNYAAPRPAGKRRCWSPRSDGSDRHDDRQQRRSHNVLERRRRGELKRSFLALRDQVPAVAHNEKAAKILILKKATELVEEMKEEERRRRRMKEKLRKRSRRLQLRLEQLRTLTH